MAMQRRHFEVIAQIINQLNMPEKDKALLANAFANKLQYQNNHFQHDKFVTACLTGHMGKTRSRNNSI